MKKGLAPPILFAHSAEQKQTVMANTQQQGWLALGTANLEGSKTHDLKEIFFLGTQTWSQELEAKRGEQPIIANNFWPVFNPRLREDFYLTTTLYLN